MGDNVANFPDQLLEHSLRIKNAARQLVEAHLAGKMEEMPPTKNEDDALRLLRISMKTPDKRTATDYLFLMSEVYKHSISCVDTSCHWKTGCWRMKGLQFHAEKLRKQGRETPVAMTTLWNRHIELEMHTVSCQEKETCSCMNVENYKYFLMMCLSKLRKGEMEPVSSTDAGRGVMNTQHPLFPVLMHFKDQLAKRPAEIQPDPTKRSAVHLLYKIATNDFGSEDARKSAAEARAAVNTTTVAKPAPGHKFMARLQGGKVIELEQEADGRVRVIGTPPGNHTTLAKLGAQQRAVIEKEKTRRANGGFDPDAPGCSTPPKRRDTAEEEKMWAGLREKECDHEPLKKCNCTFDDKRVDVHLGMREALTRNKNEWITPSPGVVAILRARIARIVEGRGEERASPQAAVRVVTCSIHGVRWTVAYNGEVHNNFSEGKFRDTVSRYMFAAQFYPNTQVIIYNFISEKFSEGAKRMEALLRDCGGQNVVTANLDYTRKSMAVTPHSLISPNLKTVLQKGQQNKNGELVWYSGCYVRVNGKAIEHVWRDYLERDRIQFYALLAHHGAKVPASNLSLLHEKNADGNVNSTTETNLHQDLDLKNPLVLNRNDLKFAQFGEGWRAMAKQPRVTWDKEQVMSLLKTNEAREFCATGMFPRNPDGKEFIPKELFALCTPSGDDAQTTSTAGSTLSETDKQLLREAALATRPLQPILPRPMGKAFGTLRLEETGIDLLSSIPSGLPTEADVIRRLMEAERNDSFPLPPKLREHLDSDESIDFPSLDSEVDENNKDDAKECETDSLPDVDSLATLQLEVERALEKAKVDIDEMKAMAALAGIRESASDEEL